jgi:lambda family phage portal protein
MSAFPRLGLIDRVMLPLAPAFVLGRMQSRAAIELMQRHYEAAQGGRRTDGWKRTSRDANAAVGPALSILRNHARDLARNNAYGKRGKLIIGNHGVGWGIYAKPINAGARSLKNARAGFNEWAESTACDFEGLHNLYGLQRLALETIAESGEVLIRRRRRPLSERLPIPLQLQVLEPDYLDTHKDGLKGTAGGKIVLGVEFDAAGRRVAYWLYPDHPGATGLLSVRATGVSQRVPAEEIIHLYRVDRPGQVRGVTWYAPVIVTLKDHDEFQDATLMRQKIAACFAGIVTDVGGAGVPVVGKPNSRDPLIEGIEPGMIAHLPPGKSIEFTEPPGLSDHASFNNDVLARVAMGLSVTVEDLTGDYRNMPFSAAKISRISHWASVHDWQYNILIPRGCNRIWDWAMEAMLLAGLITETPGSEWTPQPMPLIEPDKEALAYLRAVRCGYMTPDEMIRERGLDPETHWQDYGQQMTRNRELGVVLDIDALLRTQAGNAVVATASSDGSNSPDGDDTTRPKDGN